MTECIKRQHKTLLTQIVTTTTVRLANFKTPLNLVVGRTQIACYVMGTICLYTTALYREPGSVSLTVTSCTNREQIHGRKWRRTAAAAATDTSRTEFATHPARATRTTNRPAYIDCDDVNQAHTTSTAVAHPHYKPLHVACVVLLANTLRSSNALLLPVKL